MIMVVKGTFHMPISSIHCIKAWKPTHC